MRTPMLAILPVALLIFSAAACAPIGAGIGFLADDF